MRFAPPLLAVALLAACTPSAPGTSPSPNANAPANAGGAMPNPALPPIPLVTGALAPRVVYPDENQLIQSRDSNFIFGSLGNGKATLTINGVPVNVLPNGSYLAFLANPPATRPVYDLVAVLNGDTARLTRTVKLLPVPPVLAPDGPLTVDSSSVVPNTRLSLADDDQVWVSVRAPANAGVAWLGDSGLTAPLVSDAPVAGSYAGDPDRWATEIAAHFLRKPTQLMITRGADTVRLALPAVAVAPLTPTFGMLGALPYPGPPVNDTDRVIIARPTPDGTYKWLLLPGTVLRMTGANGDFVHVALGADLGAWVKSEDIKTLPAGYAPRPRVAENARLLPVPGAVDLRIPMSSRPPYLVEESDHRIVLTLYDTRANTDILQYVSNDSTVREVSWTQETSDRVRFTLRLSSQPYGYLAFWDGSAFVLRVRRPPVVNPK
jgi:N-acetylmuramoyl-L-alanine amidase